MNAVRRLLAAFARAVVWSGALGAACATALLVVGLVAEGTAEPGAAALSLQVLLPYVLLVGGGLGVCAGAVHGVAQVAVVLSAPRRPRRVARCVATAVSAVLGVWFQLANDGTVWLALGLGAYVALTPAVAGWGYEARTAAAVSAARRSGASSVSRVSGSASDSSRATSE